MHIKLTENAESAILCHECAIEPQKLVVKTNRKTGGQFLGCPRYPDCRHTEPIPEAMLMQAMGQQTLF